jgi:hypothetical protein
VVDKTLIICQTSTGTQPSLRHTLAAKAMVGDEGELGGPRSISPKRRHSLHCLASSAMTSCPTCRDLGARRSRFSNAFACLAVAVPLKLHPVTGPAHPRLYTWLPKPVPSSCHHAWVRQPQHHGCARRSQDSSRASTLRRARRKTGVRAQISSHPFAAATCQTTTGTQPLRRHTLAAEDTTGGGGGGVGVPEYDFPFG